MFMPNYNLNTLLNFGLKKKTKKTSVVSSPHQENPCLPTELQPKAVAPCVYPFVELKSMVLSVVSL